MGLRWASRGWLFVEAAAAHAAREHLEDGGELDVAVGEADEGVEEEVGGLAGDVVAVVAGEGLGELARLLVQLGGDRRDAAVHEAADVALAGGAGDPAAGLARVDLR